MSDEDKERYEEDFAEDGSMPDFIPSAQLNKFVFNEKTVDTVLQDLMERGIKVEGGDRVDKSIKFYPTAEQYAVESVLRYDKVADMTEAEIYKHILKQDNPRYYAQMLMHFLYRHHPKQVEPILKKFVNLPVSGETINIIGIALKYMINFKSNETEELCLKFIIGDEEYLADIAKDYWEDVEVS